MSYAYRELREMPRADGVVEWRKPTITLDEVITAESTREEVRSFVDEWHARELFTSHNLPIRRTILLSGPSGNGKTTLAGAIAVAIGLPFGVAKYSNIFGGYLGDSEKVVDATMRRARDEQCVLMFDEADSIVSARVGGATDSQRAINNCTNIVLTGLDAMNDGDSIVIFATNLGRYLDPAMIRRMTVKIELPSPGPEERKQMAKLLEKRWPYIRGTGWRAKTAAAESLAEIEQAALAAARSVVLEKHREAQRAKRISKALLGE